MNNELENQSKNEIKSRIINQMDKMLEETLEQAPLAIRTIVTMNIGSVKQSINNMSDEQINHFINKAYDMLDYIQFGEDYEHTAS